ncbi:hypothetical protein Salat_2115500, partial [Sesamum alatum]
NYASQVPNQSSQTTTDQMPQNMSQTKSNHVEILPQGLFTSMSNPTLLARESNTSRPAFTEPVSHGQRPPPSAILQRLRRPSQQDSMPAFVPPRPSNPAATTQFRSPFQVPPPYSNNQAPLESSERSPPQVPRRRKQLAEYFASTT